MEQDVALLYRRLMVTGASDGEEMDNDEKWNECVDEVETSSET
jgi:hypothetical protein